MDDITNDTICGLPSWIGIVRNDAAAYINNIILATVNGSSAIFAFLSNLAIIVAIIKNPSLLKPRNILLCSLAFTDCLTGVSTQPLFVVWRFFFSRAWQSCLHQVLMFDVYYTCNLFTTGLSFLNVLIISFDRYYALSRPFEYFAKATKKGTVKIAIIASILWFLFAILNHFVFPSLLGFITAVFVALLFITVPIVNHIRILFAIRRHNSRLGDAVTSQQMSAVLRREKAVALDMWIVTIVLLSSITPSLFMKILELEYPRAHSLVFPWTLTLPLLTSSINPLIYFGRNKNLRNALKSMMNN